MVHNPAVSRNVLDSRDHDFLPQVRGDHKAAVGIRPGSGNVKVLGHLQNEVGRSQPPAVGKAAGKRTVFLFAQGCAVLDQAASVATSFRLRVGSCLSRGPKPETGFQGGIDRSPATAAISNARFRVCSYVLRAKGPT